MPGMEVPDGLLRAATEVLRPLVRRMLASGVPFGRLESRLRELFVRMADAEFPLPDRRQTDSRVALLTGINRKEVRRIRSANPKLPAPASFSRNLAASLISRWLSDGRATDASGRPLSVPIRAKRGPSFVKFATETTADLPPRAILDELVRTGAVERLEGERVALRRDSYVPKLGRAEKLEMLAEDPAELVDTMIRNVFSEGGELWLQRKVCYDNIGQQSIGRVRAQIRREGERFLRRVNRLLARYDRDRNPAAPGGEPQYAGLGVYYFEAPAKRARRARRKQRTQGGNGQ